LKKQLCKSNGYTLIIIPYWWDKQTESLQQTIRNVRPDLLMSHKNIRASAILDAPPTKPPEPEVVSPGKFKKDFDWSENWIISATL